MNSNLPLVHYLIVYLVRVYSDFMQYVKEKIIRNKVVVVTSVDTSKYGVDCRLHQALVFRVH
jgi:hypothetical protein